MYDTDKTTGGGLAGNAQTVGFCQTIRMHNFCPECGRKREMGWNCCPYDGTNLAAGQNSVWVNGYPSGSLNTQLQQQLPPNLPNNGAYTVVQNNGVANSGAKG